MSTPADIFLSYSRDDQTIARKFAEGLTQAGFSVWWDESKASESFDPAKARSGYSDPFDPGFNA